MLRYILVFTWIAFISILLYPPALITSLIPFTKHIPHILSRYWSKTILWVSGVKVKIIGLEHIDFKRPYVFAANHQSQYDIFTLTAHLPIQFKWMAKKSLFYIPLVGWGMKACGHIPVERENPRAAYKALLKAMEFIKQGFSIIIFPEGTRSLNGSIGPFKSGGFVLALRTGVPVVPVSIVGTFSILPKSGHRIKPGNVTIIIDRPIDVSGYTEREKEKLAQLVREKVVRNYERYQTT